MTAPPRFIAEIDTVADSDWVEALAGFEDCHYEQTPQYHVGQRGERSSHLLLRDADSGEVAAGARVALYTLPGWRHGLALVRFGPFWRRRGRPPQPMTYWAALSALIDEYGVKRGHCLTVRPRPHPEFYPRECQVLAERGFVRRRPLPAPDRFLVDLSLDEEAQTQSLDKRWRYTLRQALTNGLEIRVDDSESALATFHILHAAMVARKALRYPGMELVHAAAALAALPEPIRLRIILATYDGHAVAGAAVGVLGDMAFYVLGASAQAGLSLKAGYALQWWIVRWLSVQKLRWYELGGTGDEGLRHFKRGLIGKCGTVLHMQGEFDHCTNWQGRLATELMYRLRDARDAVGRWRRRTTPAAPDAENSAPPLASERKH